MFRQWFQLLRHELTLGIKNPGEMLYPAAFFLIYVTFFPLALGPEAERLRVIGPGILWLGLLLSTLLASAKLFQQGSDDGTLEQWLIQPLALEYTVLAKGLAQWALIALPLLLATPLLAMFLQIDYWGAPLLGYVAGSGIFVFLGMLGASLMIDRAGSGAAMLLFVMPLYIPALIFGAGMHGDVAHAEQGLIALAGLFLFVLPLSCFLTALCLRFSQR